MDAAFELGIIKDEPASNALKRAFKEEDDVIIVGAHQYFIKIGSPGMEEVLIRGLNAYGNEDMATNLLQLG